MLSKIMRSLIYPVIALFTMSLSLFFIAGVDVHAAEEFEQVWFSTTECVSSPRLSLALTHPETASSQETVSFLVEITASIPFQKTRISMVVMDESQEVVHESVLTNDLHRGRNQVTFKSNSADLAPGLYTMMVEVDYTDTFSPAQCTLPFRKVSASQWKHDISNAEKVLALLEAQLSSGYEEDSDYRFQLQVAKDAVQEAHRAMDSEDWRSLDQKVDYLKTVGKTLHAGLVFGGGSTAAAPPNEVASLEYVEIRDGGVYAGDTPVFLFGFTLDPDASTHEQLRRMKQLGLNFALKSIPIAQEPESVAVVLDEAVAAAKESGIALAVQFNQEEISGSIMDQWPELMEADFVNMSHPQFSALYMERLAGVAAALAGKPMIVCASIAKAPMFKYDGEPVRQYFIARIQERYPDRIELNRLWRAHLAEYDEITIWGEHAEHNYQNRRAYQYEWQAFHRELISLFLAQLDNEFSQIAPDVPITLTLPDQVFMLAETRHTVSREAVAAMMDLSGCTATITPGETLYAMNYPSAHAYYTLMRSYAPDKPVLNLGGDIDVTGLRTSEGRAALVRSALWESVMSGLNALALPVESNLPECPEALEAFVLTARDINRLAPIVAAFQQAQPQIGILFSEASKIMDDGIPHLESAKYAFEGTSFAGYTLRFVTESQIERGALAPIKVLILPETLAVSDETFEQLSKYVDEGGMVARVGTPIPYNERGLSRGDVIRSTSNTVLVRGMNLPTEYLHAIDAAQVSSVLSEVARPINAFGYPLEGVRSRYVEHDGEGYLYIINLRKDPVNCYLTGVSDSGRDLIMESDIDFPRILAPLEPMLIRMDRRELEAMLVKK